MTRQPCTVPGCALGEHRPGHPHLDPATHARTSDPATSHAAAAQLSDKATMLRTLLAVYGSEFAGFCDGLTAEESAGVAQYTAADGAWKRVSDLLRAGQLEDTSITRPGSSGRQQRVLRITEQGQQALR